MSNVFVIISGIGAIQCILFMLMLLIKKGKQLADWILMFWFFIFFIHLMVALDRELNARFISEIFIMTIGFLHGPMLYVYAQVIRKHYFRKVDFIHFVPFLYFTLRSFFIPAPLGMSWEITILIAKLCSIAFYPVYVLYLYYKEQKGLQISKTDLRTIQLSWIKIIAILFIVSTGISIIRLSIELTVGVAYFKIWDLLRYIILVIVIGFYGLKYGVVYKPEIDYDRHPEEKKYKHSPLKEKEIRAFQKKINTFFKENESYLESEFSLAILSKALNIPKHHLSQIINSEMNTTFYDLVNSKRIEYAMRRIKEEQPLTLSFEGLGYECGFNSKSAFYSNFKKNTGKTPGQFKKEIRTN